MRNEIKILQDWVDDTANIVVFSGAALSRESGVPDYLQMEEGYFNQHRYPPQAIMSRPFFERKPGPFFQFYRERILAPLLTAEPNAAHQMLAELERADKLRMILTQNFDGLHQDAGNRKVLELCGSVMRNDCPRCEQRISTLDLYEHPSIPYCDVDMCGGVFTPDIMLYGDPIPPELFSQAVYFTLTANLLLVLGTSLLDYPAAGVLHHYDGKKLVLISEQTCPLEARANLVIHAPIAEVLAQLRISPAD